MTGHAPADDQAANRSAASRCIAAVTGGLGGIGRGIVIAPTRRGFDVAVCHRSIRPAAADSLNRQAPDVRASPAT